MGSLADSDSIEARTLARSATNVVPTRVVELDEELAEVASDGALIIVRTAAPREPPFFAVLAVGTVDAALARASGGLFAEAVLGMSASRFLSTLPKDAGALEVEARLAALKAGGQPTA